MIFRTFIAFERLVIINAINGHAKLKGLSGQKFVNPPLSECEADNMRLLANLGSSKGVFKWLRQMNEAKKMLPDLRKFTFFTLVCVCVEYQAPVNDQVSTWHS